MWVQEKGDRKVVCLEKQSKGSYIYNADMGTQKARQRTQRSGDRRCDKLLKRLTLRG